MAKFKEHGIELLRNVEPVVKRKVAEAVLSYINDRNMPEHAEDMGYFARKQLEILRMIPGVVTSRNGVLYDCSHQLLEDGGLCQVIFASEDDLKKRINVDITGQVAGNVHETFSYIRENYEIFRAMNRNDLATFLDLPESKKQLTDAERKEF